MHTHAYTCTCILTQTYTDENVCINPYTHSHAYTTCIHKHTQGWKLEHNIQETSLDELFSYEVQNCRPFGIILTTWQKYVNRWDCMSCIIILHIKYVNCC